MPVALAGRARGQAGRLAGIAPERQANLVPAAVDVLAAHALVPCAFEGPAIRVAREGFQPDARLLDAIGERIEVIKRYPAAAALYLQNGAAPAAGWTFRNADIAHTLELLGAW